MTLLEYFTNPNSQESFILKSLLASKACGHTYWKKDKSHTTLMIEADVFSVDEVKEFTKNLTKEEASQMFPEIHIIPITPELLQETKAELAETEQEIREEQQKMYTCHKNKMNQLADAMEKESTKYYEVDKRLTEQLQRIDTLDMQLEECESKLANEEREGDIQ